MKSNHIIFKLSLLLSVLFILSCNKDERGHTGFPRLKTIAVEMASDTGAVFKGEIIDLPEECVVLEYGFVWSEYKDATNNYEKISLGSNIKKGTFEAPVNRAMIEGHTYYFKAFVKTNAATIFGTELSFVSLGSNAPIITDINPSSGSWGDTITIRGKYFSNLSSLMQIQFNGKSCSFLNYQTIADSVVKIIVPSNIDTTINKVSILYENVIYPSTKIFTLVPTLKITSISPSTGSWNSVVKIRGEHLTVSQGVYFDNSISTIIYKSDSLIEVKVPYNLNTSIVDVYVKVLGFKFFSPLKYNFVAGAISSISPVTGTVGSLVTIKCNNIRTSTAKASMLNTFLTITSRTDSSLTVQLPQFDKSGNYPFTITDGTFQVTYDNLFNYKIPEFTSIYPNDATWGDTLTIYGKNFSLFTNWSVTIGSTATIISITDNYIKVSVPYNPYLTGNYNIGINSGNIKIPCSETFHIPTPFISEVQVIKDVTETFLIIKGKYFGPGTYDHSAYSSIYIKETGENVMVVSQTNKEIKCSMPTLMNGTYSVQIKYYTGFGTIEKSNCFIVNGPFSEYYSNTNSDFTFGRYIKNDDNSFYIVTDNKNFLINHNSRSVQEISKFLPSWGIIVNNERDIIHMDFNGKTMKKTNLDNRTTIKLSDYLGRSPSYSCGMYFNGKNYFIGSNPSDYYDYNYYLNEFKEPNIWNKISQLKLTDGYINMFPYADQIFIITVQGSWKFNPSDNSLTKISANPTTNWLSLFAVIGNKAYFYTSSNRSQVYEYNMDYDTWTMKGYFPYNAFAGYYYNLNGKAYFVYTININNGAYLGTLKIIEFNPANIN